MIAFLPKMISATWPDFSSPHKNRAASRYRTNVGPSRGFTPLGAFFSLVTIMAFISCGVGGERWTTRLKPPLCDGPPALPDFKTVDIKVGMQFSMRNLGSMG